MIDDALCEWMLTEAAACAGGGVREALDAAGVAADEAFHDAADTGIESAAP